MRVFFGSCTRERRGRGDGEERERERRGIIAVFVVEEWDDLC